MVRTQGMPRGSPAPHSWHLLAPGPLPSREPSAPSPRGHTQQPQPGSTPLRAEPGSHSHAEAPRIRVPSHLRQTYIRQVGEQVNLQLPFQVCASCLGAIRTPPLPEGPEEPRECRGGGAWGVQFRAAQGLQPLLLLPGRGVGGSPRHSLRAPPSQGSPKPQASWTHNGHALDGQRVSVRSGDQDSILFIRSAQRSDSGRYELTVSLKGLEAKAAVDVLVIGTGWGAAHWRPEPPASFPRAPGSGQGSGQRAQWEHLGRRVSWRAHPLHHPQTVVLQRNQGPPAASGSWTSGAAMQPWNGCHPRTRATQSSWGTRCRRPTGGLG